MRGSHRLCATAIAGVAGWSLMSRRIIIIVVHLFLDVKGVQKSKHSHIASATAVRPMMLMVIVKDTLDQNGDTVLGFGLIDSLLVIRNRSCLGIPLV
jgi:hypothetical protein